MDTEETRRRTLREIDDAKRIRKVVESFQADSDAIDAEYAAIENLKKQLDDPEATAIDKRYCALEAEMNVMKRNVDFFGNPTPLFDQQRELQRQFNMLFSERYDLFARLREDDTQYHATVPNQFTYSHHQHVSASVGELRFHLSSMFPVVENAT